MSNNPGPASQITNNVVATSNINLANQLSGLGIYTPSKFNTSNIGISACGINTSTSGAFRVAVTTWQTIFIPCGIDAVQIALLSDVADASTYTGIKVSTQTTNSAHLVDAFLNGVAVIPTPVTFSGAANPTFPNGSAAAPVPIWSDWIPVNNLGTGPCYLIVRVYWPNCAGGGLYSVSQVGGRTVELQALGVNGFFGFQSGDQTASTTSTGSAAAGTYAYPALVRFAAQQRVPCIVQYGDSTRQGRDVNGYVESLERYSFARSLAGSPVAVSNRGISGQTTAQNYTRFVQDVAAGETWDVIIWQVASVNDSPVTAATTMQQISYAHSVIRAAKTMGARVILDGPYPYTGGTPSAAQTAAYLSARSFCLSMASAEPYITTIVYDALSEASPSAKWIAALTGDGVHPNELGGTSIIYSLKSAALDSVLSGQ